MVVAQATAKYVRTSAQKAGLVCDLIRGKDVNRALSVLQFAKKTVARDVAKVLRSAVANARHARGLRRRRRAALRLGGVRQPGPVAEAGPSGADGPGVPRREAHRRT